MTIHVPAHNYIIASYSRPPRVSLRFRVLRDGEVTASEKAIRIYRDWDSLTQLDLSFVTEDGEFTKFVEVDLATLLGQGDWLVAGIDGEPPKRSRAGYLTFTEGGTFLFNISTGEGGGSGGDAAATNALVRVDSMPASRDVVALEHTTEGDWRVAGFARVEDGVGQVELRTQGGRIYGVSVDDYGVGFVAGLEVTVGQRIRPIEFRGWLYQITEAGQLPAAEPQWWPIEGENAPRELGSARAVAVRYYRPLAHGPVPVEII